MEIIEELIIPILLMLGIGLFIVHCDKETTKEIEIIKKTENFTIHENCKEFEKKWYCYD